MSKGSAAVKGAGQGAVAGAAVGSVVPGIGTAIGAGGGAILGGLYGWLSDTSDEQADAERAKLAGMQKAAGIYEGYRPQVAAARQQGLQQQLSAYGGAANAMNLMYGTQYDPRSYAPNLGKLPVPHPDPYAPPAHPSATFSPVAPSGTPQQAAQVGGGRDGSIGSGNAATFAPGPTYGPRYGAPGPVVVTPPKKSGGRY